MIYLKIVIMLSALCNLGESLFVMFHDFKSYDKFIDSEMICMVHAMINLVLVVIYFMLGNFFYT